jgi:Synergist-CTERM protein sorting domain-containing protein
MLTLHALIVNGGSMGDTEDVTIGELNRAYIAIYDGTDDDSISDPITFEAADDSTSSSGNGGCSMAAFPAALLLLLPLVILKK